jgi:hypothetical protein
MSSFRRFDIRNMIGIYIGTEKTVLESRWSFILNDYIFEKQANFSKTSDLLKHLSHIDSLFTKLRKKNLKGTIRMFKDEQSLKFIWRKGGRWIIRVSRRSSINLADLWVKIVCIAVSKSINECVFKTDRGRTEFQIWMPPQSEDELRILLNVGTSDMNIRFRYESPQARSKVKYIEVPMEAVILPSLVKLRDTVATLPIEEIQRLQLEFLHLSD